MCLISPSGLERSAYSLSVSRIKRAPPKSFSDEWPYSPCSDDVAEKARLFAMKLKEATETEGVRHIARCTGVSHSVLVRLLNGETWADTATLAKLELGLDESLWPRHRTKPKRGK